jgi:hypothetical protein
MMGKTDLVQDDLDSRVQVNIHRLGHKEHENGQANVSSSHQVHIEIGFQVGQKW